MNDDEKLIQFLSLDEVLSVASQRASGRPLEDSIPDSLAKTVPSPGVDCDQLDLPFGL